MFSTHPEMAKEWATKTDFKNLPDKVKEDEELNEQTDSTDFGFVNQSKVEDLLNSDELHSYFSTVENFQQFSQDLAAFFKNDEIEYPTIDQMRKYLEDFKYGEKTIELTLNELSKSKDDENKENKNETINKKEET